MLTGFAHNVQQLYAARFPFNIEAGFAPGMLLYLTYWFRQREQPHAVGLYLSGTNCNRFGRTYFRVHLTTSVGWAQQLAMAPDIGGPRYSLRVHDLFSVAQPS